MKAKDFVEHDSDDEFYYIAGYTPGGAPYGITWEQAKEAEEQGNFESYDEVDDFPF